eukprot:m.290414 g.290414  ORF g.290414 m.290414 type:complete len:264 (+) comp12295_c0_seq1:128-919(+)
MSAAPFARRSSSSPVYDHLRRGSTHPGNDRLARTLANTPTTEPSAYDVLARTPSTTAAPAVPSASSVLSSATMVENCAYESAAPDLYAHLDRSPPSTPHVTRSLHLSQRPLPLIPRRGSAPGVLTPPSSPLELRRSSMPGAELRAIKAAILDKTPYFHGHISRELADERLSTGCYGSFLVRENIQDRAYILSVSNGHKSLHFYIERAMHKDGSLGQHFILSGHRLPDCHSINDIIAMLQRYPSRFPEVPRLLEPCMAAATAQA